MKKSGDKLSYKTETTLFSFFCAQGDEGLPEQQQGH